MIKCRDVGALESAYIKRHLSYDPKTGEITRDDRPPKFKGSHDKDGYLKIRINNVLYSAHRLAWFLYYGEWPESEMDHINRCRTDNRIANLRVVDRITNVRNSDVKPNKKTGVRGIHLDDYTKRLKKRYTTSLLGKKYRFLTLEDAVAFRIQNDLPI